MLRIVLADDHQIIRKGLRALLSAEPDFSIVGEAEDGLEVLEKVAVLQPDVLVLDLMMSGLNGLEVSRRLRENRPQIGIVILSMHSDKAYVLEALRSGAKAYLTKESPPEELVRAIREVGAGRRYFSPPFSEQVIESYTRKTEVGMAGPR